MTIGQWRRVPVRLHWSALLILPWYYLRTGKLTEAAIALVAYVMLILAHELGHAMVAHWRGLQVHGIALYLFHGKCHFEAPYHEEDDVWIAWGGIAAQTLLLILALTMSFPLRLLPHDWHALLEPLFAVLIPINLLTIVINLIPMQPLDGYKAWRAVPLLLDRRRNLQRAKSPRKVKRRLKAISGGKEDARKVTEAAIRKMMEK